jgi:SAM-dependent methyltransferase
MSDDMNAYFSGQLLFGDDFKSTQLKQWYEAEKEGYSGLVKAAGAYTYKYHALNERHGFRHIKLRPNAKALGIGAAYGEEFMPILDQLSRITSMDPSESFSRDHLGKVPVEFVQPQFSGDMPFEDGVFDLITSFGVMHHIANVSHVLVECARCLAPGGYMLLREPIVSMGDWRHPRKGLTKNERGIPYDILMQLAEKNFVVVRRTFFDFSPLGRLLASMNKSVFAHPATTHLDCVLATSLQFNKRYHRTTVMDRFGPASVYLVLSKSKP